MIIALPIQTDGSYVRPSNEKVERALRLLVTTGQVNSEDWRERYKFLPQFLRHEAWEPPISKHGSLSVANFKAISLGEKHDTGLYYTRDCSRQSHNIRNIRTLI